MIKTQDNFKRAYKKLKRDYGESAPQKLKNSIFEIIFSIAHAHENVNQLKPLQNDIDALRKLYYFLDEVDA